MSPETIDPDADRRADIEWAQRCVDEARRELADAEELLATLKRLREQENDNG